MSIQFHCRKAKVFFPSSNFCTIFWLGKLTKKNFLTKTKATFWQLASQKKIQKSQIQKASYGHGQITLEESKTQHPSISFITVIAHESCYFLFIAHFDSFFFFALAVGEFVSNERIFCFLRHSHSTFRLLIYSAVL